MFSLVVRRTHLYLALFLMPWLAMYCLAAMAMNHRDYFVQLYGGNLWTTELEAERDDTPDPPPGLDDVALAKWILADLGLSGTHYANRPGDGRTLVIHRTDPIFEREIRYDEANRKLTVKKFPVRPVNVLTRLHHRAGYARPELESTIWAIGSDVAVAAMLVWVATGIWMWWQIRSIRLAGAVCLLIGCGLFAAFLIVI